MILPESIKEMEKQGPEYEEFIKNLPESGCATGGVNPDQH